MRASVIIPTYNYGRYIATALESALSQGFADLEVVVVDDGSQDQTNEVVSEFENVTYIRHEHNRGPAGAWATAIDASSGDFLVKLDADDWLLPGSLSAIRKAFETHPDVGIVVGPVRNQVDSQGGRTKTVPSYSTPGFVDADTFRQRVLRGFIPTPGIAQHRRALSHHSPPRSDLLIGHDWEYLIRTSNGWGAYVLNEPMSVYRVHGSSVTRNPEHTPERRQAFKRLSEAHTDLELTPSEQRVFQRAVAETYLRVLRVRDLTKTPGALIRELRFASSLSSDPALHPANLSMLGRVGLLKTRAELRGWIGRS